MFLEEVISLATITTKPLVTHMATTAQFTPTIIADSREKRPLVFLHFPSVTACLSEGDYSILGYEGRFTVERKSISDLVQSVTAERERFERELARMRPYDFKRLLVVGTMDDIRKHRYRSQAKPKSVLASIYAFEIRYSLPCVFSATPEEAAELIEAWSYYFVREQARNENESRLTA